MALIKCPECGSQVSDKAPACIHCGCPLQEPKPQEIIWNGRDISEIENYFNQLDSEQKKAFIRLCEYFEDDAKPLADPTRKNIPYPTPQETYKVFNKFFKDYGRKNNINRHESGKFILEYLRSKNYASPAPVPVQPTVNSNVVRCPRCGSTSVTTEEQGYGLFGWIGASQKKNLCQKCGHKWWPGR